MESALLTKDELLHKISSNASWENAYSRLSKEWQNKFLNFYSGTGTLPLTYDPFFKKIFHPPIPFLPPSKIFLWGWGGGGGERVGDFWDSIGNVIEENM